MYPKLVVNLEKLKTNIRFLTDNMTAHNLSITAVTKVHSANPEVVKVFEKFPEIEYFGDSRIKNLMTYQHSNKKKILIRIPMHSEVDAVIKYADISFNSEISTIKLLNQAAKKVGKIHQILLMVDLGDLREGFFDGADLMFAVSEIMEMENVKLFGLGVNLTCYGAVIADEKNLGELIAYHEKIKAQFNIELPMISGGNSSSLYLLDDEKLTLPKGITNLRIGDAFFSGEETSRGTKYPEMFDDVFVLQAEIVELKKKPSFPIGNRGVDAFGQIPTFEDKGIRLRGILAVGRQDTVFDGLKPFDDRLSIVGASSDHLIVDFTDSEQSYHVGDIVDFKLSYGAMLATFTSKYITKEYVDGAGGDSHDISPGNMD